MSLVKDSVFACVMKLLDRDQSVIQFGVLLYLHEKRPTLTSMPCTVVSNKSEVILSDF